MGVGVGTAPPVAAVLAMLDPGNGPSLCRHPPPHSSHPLSSHCFSAAIFKALAGSKITFFSRSLLSPGQEEIKDPLILWNLLPRDTKRARLLL